MEKLIGISSLLRNYLSSCGCLDNSPPPPPLSPQTLLLPCHARTAIAFDACNLFQFASVCAPRRVHSDFCPLLLCRRLPVLTVEVVMAETEVASGAKAGGSARPGRRMRPPPSRDVGAGRPPCRQDERGELHIACLPGVGRRASGIRSIGG